MHFLSKAKITALGAYIPPKKLTNNDLEKMVETNDEWITQRTGIKERRIVEDNIFTSDLAVEAIKDMQERYSVNMNDIDLIITTTQTSDYLMPSVAAIVHGKIGLNKNAGVIDLNAACAGFVYGLYVANALVTIGQNKKVLVVAAETMSKVIDYSDRNTCILFGDGAGAFLIEYEENEPGFIACNFGSDGTLAEKLFCPSISRAFNKDNISRDGKMYQDGRTVYNYVIKTLPAGMRDLLQKANMTVEQLDWFVPHSANLRMIKSISDKIGIPMEKTLTSIEQYGNTSSASIPLAIWLAINEGKLKKGQTLALYGFGGGLSHAGVIIRW